MNSDTSAADAASIEEETGPAISVVSSEGFEFAEVERRGQKSKYPLEELAIGQMLIVEMGEDDSEEARKKRINNLRGRASSLKKKEALEEGAEFRFGVGQHDGKTVVAAERIA